MSKPKPEDVTYKRDGTPMDTMGPWTIKSVGTKTRLAVNKAAQQEGVTVGHWLDKRVEEWLADGSPVAIARTPDVSAGAAMEMLANMARAGVVVQKGVGALANRLVKRELRAVLEPGLASSSTPRLAAPKRPALEQNKAAAESPAESPPIRQRKAGPPRKGPALQNGAARRV